MPNKTPLRRIAAHYALLPTGVIPWPLVTLDSRGTILGVESHEGVDSHYGVEFYSGMLIPGMVNAHTHLELSYLRGRIDPGCGFVGFAEGLGAARNLFTARQMEQAAAYVDARMYAEGVSAAGDISNGASTFDIKKQSRIHYHTFLELFGLGAKGDTLPPLLEQARARGLSASITPHSTYSLNQRAFREAIGGERNTPLSIHFMESRGEEELFAGRGAMKEWYDRRGMFTDFTDHYASPAERIVRCMPAERKIALVHNTFITEKEVRLLKGHFADNLTLVLCPCSNRFIGGDLPPAAMLARTGVRIAVGTDSLASNTSLSMVEELKALEGVPLELRLQWATLAGAEMLGIDDVYGSLEVGKRPGIALLEGVDWLTMELTAEASTRRIV